MAAGPGKYALAAAITLFASVAIAHSRRAPAAPIRQANVADSGDLQAVQAVCSRCHGAAVFLGKPRSWNRWNEVFVRMTTRGAHPTEEQVPHIVRYFLANLTLVNVNDSPADELGPALSVSDAVAGRIVARRQKRKFTTLADLKSVAGVDPAVVEQRRARIQF